MKMNELIAESEDINFIDNPNLDALEWSQKAIAMLRQQQAEIEWLKHQAKGLGKQISIFSQALTRKQSEIEALKAGGEPVYAYRRRDIESFCTCDKDRFLELSEKPHLFETTIFYTHPAKTKHLSLQETEDGELVAVTYTDDEHRIIEVLWERPPAKTLTDEEIIKNFLAKQTQLPPEFLKVLNDNLWNLYES